MGVSLKTAKPRSHMDLLRFGQRVRRAEVVRGIAKRGLSLDSSPYITPKRSAGVTC
ncbi:MAG: hypothetical protein JW836_11395 [Deltaproteobacteria bacterium]|nr:hypothetical protein [Deltaproteobacteria bacterium]